MEKITKGHPLTQSPDFVMQNIETLKSLFPSIVKEGKIDFEELKSLLDEELETEDEFYRFTWAGKNMARREATKPSTATLRPCKEESKIWDTTKNIFIEGDNLEVLKLLQKSFVNKIKMIYIDPPYNTGKDFVYRDDYKDNLGNYLAITNQLDEEGKRKSTNTESDGRYHSNWLNMMYPRLKLAKNLLTDDGIIFISIDYREVHNLRKLCDEIFGEENFIAEVANVNNPKGRSDDKYVATAHEYVIIYKNSLGFLGGWEADEKVTKRYNKKDDNNILYREIDLRKTGDNDRKEDRENLFYYFNYNSTTKDFYPTRDSSFPNGYIQIIPTREDGALGNWRWELDTSKKNISSLVPKFMPIRRKWSVFEKDYYSDDLKIKATSAWTMKDVNSERGTEQFVELGFDNRIFPKPKPVGTLIRMIKLATNSNTNHIILDFFAGSGTTAHAIFNQNIDDSGNRRFICVQLPEITDEDSEAYKAGYKNIAEICKERIRRAGEKNLKDKQQELDQLRKSVEGKILQDEIQQQIDELEKTIETFDIGFKVFKLDSSNLNTWDGDPQKIEQTLFNASNNIKENRSEDDILYEILLKYGLDLSQPIEQRLITGSAVYNIGIGSLFICLADGITTNVADGIGKWKDELKPATCKVIFKDTGFTDVEKTNSMQILKRYGIEEVNTI